MRCQASARSEQHTGALRRSPLHVLVRHGCSCIVLLPAREGECEEAALLFGQRKLTLAGKEALDNWEAKASWLGPRTTQRAVYTVCLKCGREPSFHPIHPSFS